MGLLDPLLRKVLHIAGVALPERGKWDIVSGATARDNPTTKTTEITITASGSTPTGTGIPHVVGGVQDAATSLIVNADVSASAAIALSKTALSANAQAFLATPSSANLATLLSDETGSGGGFVRATSPTLTTPVINGQIQGAAVAIAALAIDWAASPIHYKTLAAGSSTFTFSNAASGMGISVRLTADAGGSTVTWPTMKWAGDAAPTFTAGKATVVSLIHDGTTIIGVASAEYTP